MSTDDKKINVDDITFDDMLGDGIEDAIQTLEEEPQKEIKTETNEEDNAADEQVLAETNLDDDAEAKIEEEEEVGSKRKKTTSKREDQSTEIVEEKGEEALDDTVVSQVLSTLGYEVDDAYDDTTEGLVALTKDVGAQMAEEQLDALFQKYPLIRNHLDYVMNGGDSQNFMTMYDPRSDYSKVNLNKDDVQLQKYVLGEYFKTKGHDKSFVEDLLEDYEDSGKLHTKATQAQKALVEAQQKQRAAALEQQKQQQVKARKEQKQFWDDVYNTIDESQDFKGIVVPEREKKKFFNYLSKPVTKEGYTQRDIDHSESKMDVKLAIDYLMFKGFNLDTIIDKKARTKSVKTLKDKIRGHKESLKSAKGARRTSSKPVDIDDLDLSLF